MASGQMDSTEFAQGQYLFTEALSELVSPTPSSSDDNQWSSRESLPASPASVPTPSEIRDEYDGERAQFLGDIDNYIAIGIIRVLKKYTENGDKILWMADGNGKLEQYPSKIITTMADKEWIHLVRLKHMSQKDFLVVQVRVLPEDAGRQYRRGQISEYRRSMKHLMSFVDRSKASWDGNFDISTPVENYFMPNAVDESLFYIFNTLESPKPQPDLVVDQHARNAMKDVLQGQVLGLRRDLYPYQRRSTAAMIQKEAAPARMPDPRMRLFMGPSGQKFYYDREEGRFLLQPDFYEDQRGGILAETMGYGKTLICLALILTTRGHFPQIPEGRLAIEQPVRRRTASLLEMAGASAGRYGRPWKAQFHELKISGYHHEKCIETLQRNVGRYAEPLFVPRSGNRKKDRPTEKVIKLCSTTLVIVPPNLLGQWLGEIAKHTDEGALDVLSIDHSTKDIPHEDVLRMYDLVIITKPRFEQEFRDNDHHTGKRGKNEEVFKSPLSELRWLRVIVDEGHNFASSGQRTNAMAMLDKMHIERRWVVSGTPSNALIGVEVGMAADESDMVSESPSRKAKQVLQNRQAVDSFAEERKNLEKLRLIAMNFLKLQPWANSRGDDHAAWNRYMGVVRNGTNMQKSADLRAVLQNVIVRHRIEDIEVDLTLPPLYNKVIYLQPSFYDKLSINLFLAILASNAVTSERTDQDYMFHEKNRKQLEVLISNLRQSSFHWVGLKEHDVSEAIRISKGYLENNDITVSEQDRQLLLDAVEVSEKALSNPAWRAFSTLHEIGVFINNFPDFASDTWSLDGRGTKPLLLGTVQARQAQEYVNSKLDAVDPTEGLSGAGVKAMSSARKRAAEEDATAAKNKKDSNIIEEPKLKDQTAGVRIRSNSLSSPVKAMKKIPELESTSPLASAAIVGFSSSKLSYLISRLLVISPTEKSIIFYSHNNVAFWLAESLELLGIRFLIYSNTLTVARRATYLATFNQKEDFRVLLMDLKQAAHGLHVAAASRVFIVEPIWQPGIESQAIKRAHRIGQTKPVYVETLVLEDTLEDRMLRRRKQMSNSELQKAEKSLLDDVTMNEIIKNEKFIPFTSEEDSPSGQMASLPVSEQLFGRVHGSTLDPENPDEDLVLDPADLARGSRKRKGASRSASSTVEPPESSSSTPKKQKKSVKLAFTDNTIPDPVVADSSIINQANLTTATQPSDELTTPGRPVGSSGIGSIFGGPLHP